MEIISNQRRSLVYYDNKNFTYIKIFKPKFLNKLKYFFHFRKYPGDNFNFISKELNKIGIPTVEVLSFSHYSITTKKIDGIPLDKYLIKNPNSNILDKYIDLVLLLLKNNIYCGDLSYDNFFVQSNKIIALDLEDYKIVKFCKKSPQEFLRRLEGKVDSWVFNKIKEKYFLKGD